MLTGYIGEIFDRNEYLWSHLFTRSRYQFTYHIPETGLTGPSLKSLKLKMKERAMWIKIWGNYHKVSRTSCIWFAARFVYI